MSEVDERLEALGYRKESETKARVVYKHTVFLKDRVIFYKNRESVSYPYKEMDFKFILAILTKAYELGWDFENR